MTASIRSHPQEHVLAVLIERDGQLKLIYVVGPAAELSTDSRSEETSLVTDL
jgi:hypothetical protein